MPELPEVEITRLSLLERLDGARVLGARRGKPLRWPLGCAPERLVGCEIGALERRGKYLWMPLRHPPGEGDRATGGLLWHIGMSGSLRLHDLDDPATEPGPHDHFELRTDRGHLRLNDPRRFGAVVWAPARDQGRARTLLAGLGIEPLEDGFDAVELHARLRGRRVSIKQALLAGDVVVGVGNIYCSEALFRAGIDPRAAAGRVSLARCVRLVAAIRDTLRDALRAGGTTLRDFSDAHGVAGAYQAQAGVYGREGLPCPVCARPVRRLQQGQRSTYFCPSCQKR